jgi:hypothetical protein
MGEISAGFIRRLHGFVPAVVIGNRIVAGLAEKFWKKRQKEYRLLGIVGEWREYCENDRILLHGN